MLSPRRSPDATFPPTRDPPCRAPDAPDRPRGRLSTAKALNDEARRKDGTQRRPRQPPVLRRPGGRCHSVSDRGGQDLPSDGDRRVLAPRRRRRMQLLIWQRQGRDPGTVVAKDHGSWYTSWAFGRRLRATGILGSMGNVGDTLDQCWPRGPLARSSSSSSSAGGCGPKSSLSRRLSRH